MYRTSVLVIVAAIDADVLVVCVCVCVVGLYQCGDGGDGNVAAGTAGWQGFWTDESRGYKRGMACCLFGTTLNCLYSELGIVSGTIVEGGGTAVGEWIQASENGAKCGRGNFSITLSHDQDMFTGYYTCRNNTKRNMWQERVIPKYRQPTESECAALLDIRSSKTLNGRWGNDYNEHQDVCIYSSNLRSEVSYAYNNFTSQGFFKAFAYIDNRVLNGRFHERYNRGVELLFAARNGSMGRIFWSTSPAQPIDIRDFRNSPARHQYYYLGRNTNATANPAQACIVYRNIQNQYVPSAATAADNAACHMAIPNMLVLLVVLGVLNVLMF
jgi:hypothetical protein